MSNKNRFFPLFVPSSGKRVVVIGGGAIAERRVNTLLQFDFEILVVAPSVTEALSQWADSGALQYSKQSYDSACLTDAFLVLVCTNDRSVNHRAGEDAKARGLYVSVADCKEECNVFFPAVITTEQETIGLVGNGRNHCKTKKTADWLRRHRKEWAE